MHWKPDTPTHFLVGREDGIVQYHDSRNVSSPVWSLQAHDSLTSMALSPLHPNLLLTTSTDRLIKVWDITTTPALVTAKDLGVGKVFTAQWCPDEPLVCAVGGSKGKIVVWNVGECKGVKERVGRKPSSNNSSADGNPENTVERKEVAELEEAADDESEDDDENEEIGR